jgi:hypothetical protein
VEKLGGLLRGVADALKGPPAPLVWHDLSDLPARARALVAERDVSLEEVERLRGLLRDALQHHCPHGPAVCTICDRALALRAGGGT